MYAALQPHVLIRNPDGSLQLGVSAKQKHTPKHFSFPTMADLIDCDHAQEAARVRLFNHVVLTISSIEPARPVTYEEVLAWSHM